MSGWSAAEIAADLRRQILAGGFAPGERLPSESQLRSTYGVAKATVHAAMRIVHAEGLIFTKHGIGCFVRHRCARVWLLRRSVQESRQCPDERTSLRSVLTAETDDRWLADVMTDVDVVEAGPEVAGELGIGRTDDVIRRSRTMADEGVPVALVSAFFPRSVSEGTAIEKADTGQGGIRARLTELGLTVERHVERVTCGLATDDEMVCLGYPPDQPRSPVLRIDRLTFGGGRALATVHITALAEKFELVYDIPDE